VTLRMLAVLATLIALPTVAAGATADFAYRFAHADAVIVATVCKVEARWDTNRFGDQLIVTRASLCSEPGGVLKGNQRSDYSLEVEGGTLDGVTLELSHLPLLHVGDRGLFLLERGDAQTYELAGDGLGYFQFDAAGQRVTDYYSTLTISMTAVRAVAGGNRKK
jgi:hypothetical protein